MSRDLEDILRRSLHEHAQDAPDPGRLAERVLASLEREGATGPDGKHRNWRRWAAPIAAAASVAAVAASVVGVAALGHRSHGGGNSAAQRSAPTAAVTTGVTPEHTRVGPPVGNGSMTPRASSAPSVMDGVPRGFRVVDLTFTGADVGFALGRYPCAAGQCAAVARISGTTNPTWRLVTGQPGFTASSAAGSGQVGHVRFADRSHGYAFGPDTLWSTGDGGRSWQRTSGGADAIEIADGNAVRVSHSGDCRVGCRYELSQAAVGSTDWQPAAVAGAFPSGTAVLTARSGRGVFLVVGNGAADALYASDDDGRTWTQRQPDLCRGSEAGGTGPATAVSLATAADGTVTTLCRRADRRTSYTLTSTDAGRTFDGVGSAQALGAPATTVAVARRGVLLICAERLYRSTDGGASWTPGPRDAGGGPGAAVSFLGFEDDNTGRWVNGNGSTVWTTDSAGQAWRDFNVGI